MVILQLFFSLSINVVLTMVFTWSNGNLITYPSSNDIGEALEIFHRYLRAQSRLQFDLALLIRYNFSNYIPRIKKYLNMV